MKLKLLKLFFFCVIWMIGDFILNRYILHIPGIGGRYAHKIESLHFLAYGLLGLWCGLKQDPFWTLAILGWSCADEALQLIIPGRVSDIMDVIRNFIGFMSVYLIVDFIKQIMDRRKQGLGVFDEGQSRGPGEDSP